MLKGRKWLRLSLFWLLAVFIIFLAALFIHNTYPLSGSMLLSASQRLVDATSINRRTISPLSIEVQANNAFDTRYLLSRNEAGEMGQNMVMLQSVDIPSLWDWLSIVVSIIALLLVCLSLTFLLPRIQSGSSQERLLRTHFGNSFHKQESTVKFASVAGIEEIKKALQEIVDFLKYPEKFTALGVRIPHGLLLIGPPGTGKTLIANAVAGEAGVPFFSLSGAEFVEMLVEGGVSKIHLLFKQARRSSPCIIFIDEIDTLSKHYAERNGGAYDSREQILRQVLLEMDNFERKTNIIVIAATSRPDMLDLALLQPGHFDRQIILDRPDVHKRIAILRVHARGKPLEKDIILDTIAKQTPGFSGADLANLLNEAAILAVQRDKHSIGMKELEEAVDRVMEGPRRSRIISEREKSITAYHEVGHAIVARMLRNTDPVHKVSIVARGQAGGFTILLPTEDRYLWSKPQFEDLLAYALGGRVAELIIFGEVTTGASSDIEQVTDIARSMVTEYGMSERMGPVALTHSEKQNYSEQTAREIDEEVRRIIQEAFDKAHTILLQNKTRLIMISERLIKEETLEGPVFESLFNQPLNEEQEDSPSVFAGMPGVGPNSGPLPKSLPQPGTPSLVWQPQIRPPQIQKPYNHNVD